jgi:hypothetical protein
VNALHFLQAIEDAILNGFYANTSIEGYPQLGFPLQVRMFEGETPDLRFNLNDDIEQAFVQEYDPIVFLLNFQSAVQQGFSVQDTGTNIDPVGLKQASMQRSVQKGAVVLDIAQKATESVTEAPKPKAQTNRKQTKSKEV